MQIGAVLAWDSCAVCTRGGYCADRDRISLRLLCGLHKGEGTVQIGTVLAWDFCAVCTREGGTVQIGTVLAWDFCAVCTRRGVVCR